MASGDAQRQWFPDMIEDLKNIWRKNITWEELSDFCITMTKKRDNIRKQKNIKKSKNSGSCSKCGGKLTELQIGIRSALFTLKKHKIITENEFKDLDKDWKKFKKKNNLDIDGKPKK